jgi:hypothetical protein
MNYMANQPREIDPRFFLPPNVVDIGYVDTTDVSSDDPNDIIEVDYEVVDESTIFDTDNGGSGDALEPPDSIVIVSQTARTTSGGVVVDVVIDVDEQAGITEFGVRVTKP